MVTKDKINMSKSGDKYHWILYHLEAMEYGKKKIDTRMAKLPSSIKLQDADPKKLKKVISELKEIISWYKKFVEYHQQKALSHIPETEKTKWAKQQRDAENKSLEGIFLTADKLLSPEAKNEEFKSVNNVQK